MDTERLTKGTILVVDDSEIIREMLSATLCEAGYCVHTVDSQFATAQAIVQRRPDLVLLDVSMPGLNGDQIVTVMRSSPLLKNTRVVLLSDKPVSELSVIAQTCGADGYIQKTSSDVELLREVERWFRTAL